MRHCLIALLMALLVSFAHAQQSERYRGSVEFPNGQLFTIVIVLTPDEAENAWKGQLDIVEQGVTGLELFNIERSPTRLQFTARLPGAPEQAFPHFDFRIEDKALVGTMRQGPLQVPAQATPDTERRVVGRPQDPQRPLPYREIDVSVPVVIDGELAHDLAGTLTLPDPAQFGEGPFPGVVLLTGSGPQDRDEALMGHRPFLVLSDHLTRAGIAVLRYDDRGVGQSGGSFAGSTMEDFAHDARAAASFLAEFEGVDPKRVGLLGHSEGGIVAPMVVASDQPHPVSFLVLLAGPSVPGGEVIAEQSLATLVASGVPPEQAQASANTNRMLFSMLAHGAQPEQLRQALIESITQSQPQMPEDAIEQAADQALAQLDDPWLRHFVQFDPAHALASVQVPVLAVFAERDLQVLPSQNEPPLREALKHNEDTTIVVLEGLNHLFQPARTGLPTEYAQIQTTIDESLLQLVSGWITERFAKAP